MHAKDDLFHCKTFLHNKLIFSRGMLTAGWVINFVSRSMHVYEITPLFLLGSPLNLTTRDMTQGWLDRKRSGKEYEREENCSEIKFIKTRMKRGGDSR